MKNSSVAKSLKLIAAGALLCSAASGFAATTWTPGATSTCGAGATTATGCGSSGGVSLTGQAFSTTGSGSTFASAALYDYGNDHMGVVASGESPNSSPDHSMDNAGATDLISLKFSSDLVALTTVTTGWVQGDSDMSLLAYKGSNTGYSILGKTTSQLVQDGWTLVANINGTGDSAGANYANLNGSGITSSWWIISAFNSGYGGNQTGLDGGDDYVKLLSVAGDIKTTPNGNKVPEPGSLALMGAAFCAVLAARRRKANSV